MTGTLNLTELRAGGVQDLPAVNTIMQEAFDPRYGEAWTTSQCMGMLSLPGVWLTLAAVGDKDVGFALARSTGLEAELLLLATSPRARSRGVGGALLRAVVAEAAGRGVKDLHLEVRAGNEATRLYQREGFTKVGERRSYYRGKGGQLFDAQTFARKL
ncbi:MAG: GNAT family N-acetyltransferase [Pseudomonadota bacterium]